MWKIVAAKLGWDIFKGGVRRLLSLKKQ